MKKLLLLFLILAACEQPDHEIKDYETVKVERKDGKVYLHYNDFTEVYDKPEMVIINFNNK